jgi:adenylate kinase
VGSLISLMGPTGAGKSAQGDLLAEKYGWAHLSSGKLLRRDPHAAALMVDGRLAPAEEVERVVREAIEKIPATTPVVLDGTPRTDHNVEWLDHELPKLDRKLVCVIMIELDIETSLKRLGLRGRADDLPAAIREKWALFEKITSPVVEHYRKLGLLEVVDGRGTIEEVHEEIVQVLEKVSMV